MPGCAAAGRPSAGRSAAPPSPPSPSLGALYNPSVRPSRGNPAPTGLSVFIFSPPRRESEGARLLSLVFIYVLYCPAGPALLLSSLGMRRSELTQTSSSRRARGRSYCGCLVRVGLFFFTSFWQSGSRRCPPASSRPRRASALFPCAPRSHTLACPVSVGALSAGVTPRFPSPRRGRRGSARRR